MFGAVQCTSKFDFSWDDVINVEGKQKPMKYLVKSYICNVIRNITTNIIHCTLSCNFLLIMEIIQIFRFENDLVENENVDGKL